MTEVVLVLNWSEELGGVQTATRSLAAALRAEGAGVRILSAFPREGRASRADAPALFRGVPWRRLPRRLRRVVGDTRGGRVDLLGRKAAVRRLREAARDADVVVAMDVFAVELVASAALPGARRFVQYHNTFSNIDGTRDLDRIVEASASLDGVVALTEADAQGFRERVATPVHSVPNALPGDVQGEVPHPDGLVVGLGRYTPAKNFSLLVDAWARMSASTRRGWRLQLHGEGPEGADLVRRAGTDPHVTILPPTDDAQSVLADAAILVLPSEHEGLPMVLLEAMAAGVSCIATRSSPGVEELIGDGAGWLVPTGDAAALAEALSTAMADPQERANRSRLAFERLSAYSPSSVARRWLDLAAAPLSEASA